MSNEPLTADELATLAAHGYEPAGSELSKTATLMLCFVKDGRVAKYSRDFWREIIAELTAPPTEDVAAFGAGAWIYCSQHMKPHQTGWCTVSVRDKVGLGVDNAKAALEKCRAWKFPIYGEK